MQNPETLCRSVATRLLHGTLLLAVLWQLVGSNFIERPRAATPANMLYEVHEVVGLATLALVLAFWLWSLLRRRETPFAALFPWFSASRVAAVGRDLRQHWAELKKFRLPGGDAGTPLASAVHGLGLLTALAMAATGTWLFALPMPGGLALEFHKLLSNLMWAYVLGHAGLAVLHQFTGDRVLQRMFCRGRSGTNAS